MADVAYLPIGSVVVDAELLYSKPTLVMLNLTALMLRIPMILAQQKRELDELQLAAVANTTDGRNAVHSVLVPLVVPLCSLSLSDRLGHCC